mmetsp:Transcript_28122/g.90856  ORF Transcript_28122/g.90856 Transcript_28122/m.90856 type:complete len:209 (-) Transcript_28122:142-768(-)
MTSSALSAHASAASISWPCRSISDASSASEEATSGSSNSGRSQRRRLSLPRSWGGSMAGSSPRGSSGTLQVQGMYGSPQAGRRGPLPFTGVSGCMTSYWQRTFMLYVARAVTGKTAGPLAARACFVPALAFFASAKIWRTDASSRGETIEPPTSSIAPSAAGSLSTKQRILASSSVPKVDGLVALNVIWSADRREPPSTRVASLSRSS